MAMEVKYTVYYSSTFTLLVPRSRFLHSPHPGSSSQSKCDSCLRRAYNAVPLAASNKGSNGPLSPSPFDYVIRHRASFTTALESGFVTFYPPNNNSVIIYLSPRPHTNISRTCSQKAHGDGDSDNLSRPVLSSTTCNRWTRSEPNAEA